ncbi:tetratricopeptide repeat protein [Puniceicoccus vermicola]|uniref:Tetratricopeptide repeat protein n=1 Tax=Puniceicoccus vermicola TaxID=388746 RepID=A0A7X1E562_9BACT|nr:tetratricopeptide repeat protein [Puniceicoccus vermicola]MBC2602826.1 tetratricopeptide repeat protein [Puniceicoccus vermicola]
MRTVSKRLIFAGLLAGSLVAPLQSQDAPTDTKPETAAKSETEAKKSVVSEGFDDAMKRYGANPVDATQINGPNQYSPIILVDFTVGGLVMRYPNLESPITIPEDQLTFAVGYRPKLDSEKYAKLVEEGENDQALELIREEVYPLLKYVPINPQTVRIHPLVTRLLDELIASGNIDEAAAILRTFPRDRLTGYFRPQAVEVASQLVEIGEIDKAYDMVKQFPIGPGQMDFALVYLNLANEFRLRGEWEKARNLYKDVQLASSASETPEAFLWEAYIHLQEDRAFMVDGILGQFDDLDADSRYFSLRELVRGALLESQGNEQQALSALAKGLVYSTTNDPWTPELLFRTANLYEAQDFLGAASEIRDQLRFFYPDSIWVDRLEEDNS